MTRLSVHDIASGLRDLGLRAGVGVMVHSSLKSLGRTADGAKTVIEALREVLTPDGTLLMPSFNHGSAFAADAVGYYSPQETRTTNGAIPDCFWRMPGVLRTLNPTHAFAGWGAKARQYLKDHHRTLTTGPDSPLGRLWRDGGLCLFIGTDYRTNTFRHVVEVTGGAPCLGPRTEALPVKLPDGRLVRGRTWGWRAARCPITDPVEHAGAEMARRGFETRGSVGEARCVLFRLDDYYAAHSRLLAEGVGGHPPCSRCAIRPRTTPQTVTSDWDLHAGRLKPDSEAWTYEDGIRLDARFTSG